MDQATWDKATALLHPHRKASLYFNGGGPASTKSKDYLRYLLGQHNGTEEAQLLRAYFNWLREAGESILRQDVDAAIALLKSL